MAPLKQPDTLYNLACNSSISLLHNSFTSINRRHGAYGSEGSCEAVRDLQAVLLTIVPSIIWTDLCERLLRSIPLFMHERLVGGQKQMFSDDEEILKFTYALFANKKLTSIALVSRTEHPSKFAGGSVTRHNSLEDTEKWLQFWDEIFMNSNHVRNIVFSSVLDELDFSMILYRICKHCQDLEKICFSNKIHVSTEACYLLKCTKLRRIEGINCLKFSPVEYKLILDSLPELEYFPDSELVSCFPEMESGRELKLTELLVSKKGSTPANIALVARICPKLKHLKIHPDTVECCSAILEGLANSTLYLTSLYLWSSFPSSDQLQLFFSTKGVHLVKLQLACSVGCIAFKTLKIIGDNCINLQFLYVKQMCPESNPVDHPTASDMLIDHRSPLFKKLHNLSLDTFLGGFPWDHRVAKWSVLHAANLETLTLHQRHVRQHRQMNVEDFRDMFAVKRLADLVNVKLRLGPLTKEMITCLYENCPKMRKLDIASMPMDVEAKKYVNDLKQHIASSNIDLIIIC